MLTITFCLEDGPKRYSREPFEKHKSDSDFQNQIFQIPISSYSNWPDVNPEVLPEYI